MRRKYSKYCVALGLSCAIIGFSVFTLRMGSVAGEEEKKFQGFHTTSAPVSPATAPVPDEKYSPKMTTVKVEEILSYEIAVPEEKLKKRQVEPVDLELVTAEKDKINFHQVECFYYRTVTQKQTRTSSAITCTRTREGLEYWLTDKTRFVEWGPWSEWVSR
ncbi:MAG TPA: hypothetical protein ACFYD6_05405 [Candidatus Brocadiia bacterium]|nr:hypothetical protein [Planctomycetota bacterium]MBI4008181.1 hypothetical protein [Planctomycetota bacterium]MDO8091924.1 hypothetical protein [Candidatus Brocadiales bacterium]